MYSVHFKKYGKFLSDAHLFQCHKMEHMLFTPGSISSWELYLSEHECTSMVVTNRVNASYMMMDRCEEITPGISCS